MGLKLQKIRQFADRALAHSAKIVFLERFLLYHDHIIREWLDLRSFYTTQSCYRQGGTVYSTGLWGGSKA